jgi:DNA-binding response OmpR family regulator
MKILIIEDERKTAALLSEALLRERHEVCCAYDGETGHAAALADDWDAVIVDIMLPGMDGLALVASLRTQDMKAPILMLSARSGVDQRVEGLDVGADDFLPKPFALSELFARLRSLVRRGAIPRQEAIELADLTYDPATREVRRAGRRIDLSSREALLLDCLLKAAGQVVSRRDIFRHVWEYDFDPGSNLAEVYIRRLREKIDRNHALPLIQTVRGLGYAMRLPPS